MHQLFDCIEEKNNRIVIILKINTTCIITFKKGEKKSPNKYDCLHQ